MSKFATILLLLILAGLCQAQTTFAQTSPPQVFVAGEQQKCDESVRRACSGVLLELQVARQLIEAQEKEIAAIRERLEIEKGKTAAMAEANQLLIEKSAALEDALKAEREAKAALEKLIGDFRVRVASLEKDKRRNRRTLAGAFAAGVLLGVGASR